MHHHTTYMHACLHWKSFPFSLASKAVYTLQLVYIVIFYMAGLCLCLCLLYVVKFLLYTIRHTHTYVCIRMYVRSRAWMYGWNPLLPSLLHVDNPSIPPYIYKYIGIQRLHTWTHECMYVCVVYTWKEGEVIKIPPWVSLPSLSLPLSLSTVHIVKFTHSIERKNTFLHGIDQTVDWWRERES